jgi:cytidylate kinase
MKLIIIRGPSGSGKSTLARHLGGEQGVNWFEADMFFNKDGKYLFDPRKLGQAHVWCQTQVIEALMRGKIAGPSWPQQTIIVSNTSTTLAEVNTYVDVARRAMCDHEVIRTSGPWNPDELVVRNEHNVPRQVLEKQIARYVAVEGEREWSDLSIFRSK